MKTLGTTLSAAIILTACNGPQNAPKSEVHHETSDSEKAAKAAEVLSDADMAEKLKKTVITSDRYPAPPEPNFGPQKGSITFTDTDPSDAIGGTLTMNRALDAEGNAFDEEAAGLTTYMIHWGLEVGAPGTEDDAGAGDLGGDCMGFRDTGHVVMMKASQAGDTMSWEIPQGTIVPKDAVYFVGHTLYGKIHNLGKCTQTPIVNLRND